MKTGIIALSASAFLASAPFALAQDASGKTPGLHNIPRKYHAAASSHAPPRTRQAKESKSDHPRAFGYVPNDIVDRETEITRKAGGGM